MAKKFVTVELLSTFLTQIKKLIPTVNNSTITISQAGNTKGTFTLNQTGDTIISLSDNNTVYNAGGGLSLTGTTFSNSGVRSVSTGSSNGTISVNTNGTTSNVPVKGLGSAAYTNSNMYSASSHNHDSSYLKLSGGTVTGATSFTEGTDSTSKTSGTVKVSGGVGVTGQVSASTIQIEDKVTLQYNSDDECLEFKFS